FRDDHVLAVQGKVDATRAVKIRPFFGNGTVFEIDEVQTVVKVKGHPQVLGVKRVKLHEGGLPETACHFGFVGILEFSVFPRLIAPGVPVAKKGRYYHLALVVKQPIGLADYLCTLPLHMYFNLTGKSLPRYEAIQRFAFHVNDLGAFSSNKDGYVFWVISKV